MRRWSGPPGLSFDWDGGTRIGDSLDAFVRGWARRGVCRGGIVVVCSDGWTAGIRPCSPRRWSGCPGCATGWCG